MACAKVPSLKKTYMECRNKNVTSSTFFNGPTPLEVRKSKSKILNSRIYLQFLKNNNLIFTQEKKLILGAN